MNLFEESYSKLSESSNSFMKGNSMNQRSISSVGFSLKWRMYLVIISLPLIYLIFISILGSLGVPWEFYMLIAGGMFLFQYFQSTKLVLKSIGAKEVTEDEEPELHRIIERLSLAASIPKPKVAVSNTDVPNAFAAGRDVNHSVICVTEGLRKRLDPLELEGVIGHEVMHIVNRDVSVMTFANFFAMAAATLMSMFMWASIFGSFGGRNRSQGGMAFMIAYAVSVLVYFLCTILMCTLSRYREYAADRGGSILTGDPSKLASALQKISSYISTVSSKDLRKMETANALFIISALKGESLAGLFASHPPLDKRVQKLQDLKVQMSGTTSISWKKYTGEK